MKKKIRVFLPEDFPIVIKKQYPQTPIALHSHDFDELVIIQKGRGIHFTENESLEIIAGNVFIIRRGRSHGYRETSNLHLINILFHLDALSLPKNELKKLPGYHALFKIYPERKRLKEKNNYLFLAPNQLAHASALVDEINSEISKNIAGYEFMATAHFMRLVAFLSRTYSRIFEKSEDPVYRLANAISRIERDFRQPLDLKMLCGMSSMSRSTFFRVFKRTTGLSPINYQINLRISHASKLLKMGNFSVKEAAFASGFKDSNYFSRQFKKCLGQKPRQFLNHCG
jgi:AraC-like DNA-binding protein